MQPYGTILEQMSNLQKSRLFFSKNVGRYLKWNISLYLGIGMTSINITYLGNPLLLQRRNKSMVFQDIIDKIINMITSKISFEYRKGYINKVSTTIQYFYLHREHIQGPCYYMTTRRFIYKEVFYEIKWERWQISDPLKVGKIFVFQNNMEDWVLESFIT